MHSIPGTDRSIGDPSSVPPFFSAATQTLSDIVKSASVTGVFLTKMQKIGHPNLGGFSHLSFSVPISMRYNEMKSETEASAELAPRYENIIAQAKWFERVRMNTKNVNMLWLDVARAPLGYCHIATGVVGNLLDAIVKELHRRNSNMEAEKIIPLHGPSRQQKWSLLHESHSL